MNKKNIKSKEEPLVNSFSLRQVKGFKDFTGKDAEKRAEIKKILVETFEKYGYEPAETPIVEYEEFVKGNNEKDEAVSDIFKLQDKGKRKLALRYEFTFQIKRIMQNKKLPYRRYQIGEVFRDEPASSNRFRQFTQCDIDSIGSNIRDEAEILSIIQEILNNLNISAEIYVGNRKLLNEILDEQKVKQKDKENVLREIDKLEKISEKEIIQSLKKYNAEKVLNILKNKKEYFKKYSSYSEIEELENFCTSYGLKINFCPSLVRGLSYYNGNLFEIKTKSMKETIIAGGSYCFENVQCTGISLGLDRISLIADIKTKKEKFMVVSIDKDKESIVLAKKLREKGKNVILKFGKPSKALEYANSYDIKKIVFVGEKELKEKKFKVKDMDTGKESLLVL
jgi:histidyl-tRNA synthetase